MNTNQPTSAVALVPREGLFFKDGRGWGANGMGRGHALPWPWPSTLVGAICTALGRLRERTRDTVLSKDEWKELHEQVHLQTLLPLRRDSNDSSWGAHQRMWPAPADAFTPREGDWVLPLIPVRPQERGGQVLATWSDEQQADEAKAIAALWHPSPPSDNRSKPGKAPSWWTEQEWINWMLGEPVKRLTDKDLPQRSLLSRTDIHVSINSLTGAADEGMLYARETMETLHQVGSGQFQEWTLGLRGQWPASTQGSLEEIALTLGGKRRLAGAHLLPDAVFDCPEELVRAFDEQKPRGLRLFAVTPCLLAGGWRPQDLQPDEEGFRGTLPLMGEVILRAACVSRPRGISGWDMDKHKPRPTRLTASPGSVWFLERVGSKPWTGEDIKRLWLSQWGQEQKNGFGCVVPGLWHPERERGTGDAR